MSTIIEEIKNFCFFCSTPIEDKKTLEHIIPNSLLGKLGIKEEKIDGAGSFQYSRVKVPAHKSCNSGFGSAYEDKVIQLLSDTDKLYEDLKLEEDKIPTLYSPNLSTTMIISTWLSKIYYGLFYNDYLKIADEEYKERAKSIIFSNNFKIVQNAYRDGVGFCLPSSLYVFKSNTNFFDLRTFFRPRTILMKVNTLTMILCIEDGFLTKNYLNGEALEDFRKKLQEKESKENFPSHLNLLAEIVAVRVCIPKSPKFIYTDKQIVNMSSFSLVKNPEQFYKVNEDEVNEIRKGIFTYLTSGIKD